MDITQPEFIPVPWAANGQKASIPEEQTSAGNGRASWKTGFPTENTLPVSQGGVPANYQDFQGVLYSLSENVCYQQAGGMFTWSATIDYQPGARVLGSDGKAYISTAKSGPSTSVVNPVGDASGKWLLDANMVQVSSAASAITQDYVTSGGYTISGDVTVTGTVNGGGLVHIAGAETISGTKTFTSTISGNITGSASYATSAGQATKLTTARTVQTDLGATTSASFDGTANIAPGVTGTLAVANGGTGVTTIADIQAGKDGAGNTITDTYVTQTEYDAAIENLDETKAGKDTVAVNTKNIANIASLLNGALSVQNTDSTSAYAKTVPSKAQPYAAIDLVGGRTVVWNQLFKPNNNISADTCELSDVTFTNNHDGSWTLSGTASAKISTAASEGVAMAIGHKYLLCGCPADGSATTYRYTIAGIQVDTGEGGIYNNTTYDGNLFGFRFDIDEGTNVTGLVWKPRAIDLTLMFGSGNEPSTVAEFQAMFPSIDPAYNPGQLISAGVTGAVSAGKNILNLASATVQITDNGGTGASYNTATQVFTIPQAPAGTYIEFLIKNISFDFYAGDTVTFTLNGSSLANVLALYLYDSIDASYFVNGEFLTGTSTQTYKTISVDTHRHITQIMLRIPNGYQISNCSFKFQIERGSTATAYTPYRAPITLPIPAAVQALPGYGWSAGSVYNYIDWQRKVYVQRVGSANLGNLTWAYDTSPVPYFRTVITSMKSGTLNTVCAKYSNSGKSSISNVPDKETMTYQTQFRVRDSAYTDKDTFTTAMSGVMLYYELTEPVETDISSLLSDDNLISVEPGGTVTFPSSLGDDYRLPVPSDVEYTIDMAPDTPSTDGTYTLQCVVADGEATYSWVSA